MNSPGESGMLPLDLTRTIAGVCEAMKCSYFVTGSVASSFYGEFRTTHDVDVVVELPSWRVKDFCDMFHEPDWYVSGEAAMTAAQNGGMFNIIHLPSGLKLDIVCFSGKPEDEGGLLRARKVQLPGGGDAMFAAPEDVILSKLQFFREGGSDKHLRDIAGMLKISADIIDRAYIEHWAMRLGVTKEWTMILERLAAP